MAATIQLDTATWDLTLDAAGNIALLDDPGSFAQDAASAIRTFLGECYLDTTIGVPWLTQILGKTPSIALLKQDLIAAALTVDGVASAQVFISAFSTRAISGQVQVIPSSGGDVQAANFTVLNPTGEG